jgi:Uma2 family endonuclease
MAVSIESIPQAVSMPPVLLPESVWRISVEQYHQMIDAGILTDDDPVELLEGILVTKMPKKPPHSLVTQLTRDALARLILLGWCINVQEPITLADSEPEPDVVVVRGERRQYADHHPGAQDTALVIEVSDTTLSRDRGLKKRMYAAASIPTYWVINLVERQIEVYTEPSGSDYFQRQDYGLAAEVPVVIEGQEIGRLAVREILP